MRRISSQWKPVYSALAVIFPLIVAVPVAVGFGREGKWLPVAIAAAFAIYVLALVVFCAQAHGDGFCR
jgi:hypothetical protein